MSNEIKKTKRTVKITENDLIDLVDKLVAEAVSIKKVEWLAEQETKKNTLLENKIADLEKKINKLTEGK